MKKRILFILLSLALVLVFAVGCGTYTPPIIRPDDGDNSGITDPNNPNNPNNPSNPGTDPSDEELTFTVKLVSNGRDFQPTQIIFAQWSQYDPITNKVVSQKQAQFNTMGVASVKGLDGEYRVTLSNLPYDYTYDPNGNEVDNDNRDLTIELLTIIRPTGSGSDYYHAYTMNTVGTYEGVLDDEDGAWFMYKPSATGIYSIESWVDTTDNTVNPVMEYWLGSAAWYPADSGLPATGIYDDGGSSSTFTKNFRFELDCSAVGQVWGFRLYANSQGGFPVTIYFTIKYEGDSAGDDTYYEPIDATGPFWTGGRPSGTWTYNYADSSLPANKRNHLDASRFKLWPVVEGGDGYYHLYDEVQYSQGYTEAGKTYPAGYGPVLFAMLSRDCEVFTTDSNQGFLFEQIRPKVNGYDYTIFLETYSRYCVDGAHPVTEEIKEFLQGYAIKEGYFMDGSGWAEVSDPETGNPPLTSSEYDQWLFACGYFK